MGSLQGKADHWKSHVSPRNGSVQYAHSANSLAGSSHREVWLQGKHDGESRDSSWYSQLLFVLHSRRSKQVCSHHCTLAESQLMQFRFSQETILQVASLQAGKASLFLLSFGQQTPWTYSSNGCGGVQGSKSLGKHILSPYLNVSHVPGLQWPEYVTQLSTKLSSVEVPSTFSGRGCRVT